MVSLFLLGGSSSARAASVAIVRPPPRLSSDLNETLARIHGELLAVGLEVEIANRPPGLVRGTAKLRAWLEELAVKRGVDAVVDISGDPAPPAVDVWVIDRTPVRLELSRIDLEPESTSDAEQLSVRAIEVLRSRFLERDLSTRWRRSAAEVRPAVGRPAAEVDGPGKDGSHAQALGIQVGAAGWMSLDGVGPALLPTARVDWAVRRWWLLHAAVAGLGTQSAVVARTGTASVVQQYGVVGTSSRLRSDSRLRPFAALSVGVLHTSIEGHADVPKAGHTSDRWSALLDGSVGAELGLSGPYFLSLAAHAQVAAPYVSIYFVDEAVASSGRPNLLLSLAVGVWL
jgi:hypothetical protein